MSSCLCSLEYNLKNKLEMVEYLVNGQSEKTFAQY